MGLACLLRELGVYGILVGLLTERGAFAQHRGQAPDSIVIFDSQVPIGTGQGVYMTAVAQEAAGEVFDRALEVFSRRSLAHGGGAFTRADVAAEAGLRLYRATAQDLSILANDGRPDHRIPAQLNSPGPGHALAP